MNDSRWPAIMALLLVASPTSAVPAQAIVAAPPAAAGGGIARLAFYAGHWRLESTTLATPHSKAGTTTMSIDNVCQRFLQHLSCAQTVDGKPAQLIVFTYDPASARYTSLPIGADGNGHAARLRVEGNRLTFPWQDTVGGALVWFRVVNTLDGADTIAYAREYSNDGEHWLPIESGTEHRVK